MTAERSKASSSRQAKKYWDLFPVLDFSPLLVFMKRQGTRSDTRCAASVSRKYLAISVFSFRNGNVSQALVRSSSLQESVSVSLQKEPTEGASNHAVVTSEQNSEPPASLLPRHPSEDQKLYQDLLVIHVNLVLCTECNSQNSTLLKL